MHSSLNYFSDYSCWIWTLNFFLMLALIHWFMLVDLAKEGNTLVLSNAKIDMFKGSMRLAVDRSGRVEVGEAAGFSVDESNNLSLIEFERIDVVV